MGVITFPAQSGGFERHKLVPFFKFNIGATPFTSEPVLLELSGKGYLWGVGVGMYSTSQYGERGFTLERDGVVILDVRHSTSSGGTVALINQGDLIGSQSGAPFYVNVGTTDNVTRNWRGLSAGYPLVWPASPLSPTVADGAYIVPEPIYFEKSLRIIGKGSGNATYWYSGASYS